ncbi:lamin tail domain-containing protein [Eubacteriales bacterium OttesenSCG-928-K08]|nr:lamin tail domain-containing protein [Eubacteriales bacterium OttesenSCG-928-K08]
MNKRGFFLLIAAVLVCVVVLIFVFSAGGQSPDSNGNYWQLQINEVMTSNKGAVPDANGNFPDWVEIYNPTETDINISGFGLSDELISAAKWAFPSGTILPAGGYIVVYCSGDTSLGALHAPFKLSATDVLILSNATGKAIDNLQLTSVSSNATLGRNETGAWVEMAHPSPGYPNTEEGIAAYRATLQETMQDNGIRINEFMASNATTLPGPQGNYPDWIELYNTTGADVDISGCGLSDDIDQPMKWIVPEGTIIPANSVKLVYCSGLDGLIDGELHAPFGLRAYAEDVVFSGRNGAIIDSFSYTNQEADISMARKPDGFGEFESTAQPTPGYLNTEAGLAEFSLTSIFPVGGLMISEVMNNNTTTTVNGVIEDWIELHNSSNTAINLSGYALSDNPKNPAKWVFPDVTIEAGSYLTLLATGNNVTDTEKKTLETSFKLAAEGEVLLLFSPDAVLLDKLSLRNTGADISHGRTGGVLLYYDKPTPGEANGAGYQGITQQPTFSVLPGIFNQPFSLELTANSGTTIYYTTDSSVPTTASTQYSGPIQLSKNTVVRALAVQQGYLSGRCATGTYLFTTDGVNHQLPVATLVFDPPDLWDSKKGIYVKGDSIDPDEAWPYIGSANYGKKGDEWERSAAFAIFDENGTQVFSQNISARIAGAFGRGREQKGFNLIARDSEGKNRMDYPFFAQLPYDSYKALVLRAGGQDQANAKIKDELAGGLLAGTDVNFLYQAYKPYVLYLNGEYWGVYFLKEKRNRFFVAQHEELENADNMTLMRSASRVHYGSSKEWQELMNYIKANSLKNKDAYDYVASRVDLDSFMDYQISEIYVANSDYWNIQYYKVDGGKWKWIYYDFCWGFDNSSAKSLSHKTLSLRRLADKPCSDLFNALLENADWRDSFLRRFAEIMNTVYAPERMHEHLDKLYAQVEPEIERERAKFNGADADPFNRSSYQTFIKKIEEIRQFIDGRPAEMKAQIKAEFNLSDSYMQEVFG